jgi:hypothetical protein
MAQGNRFSRVLAVGLVAMPGLLSTGCQGFGCAYRDTPGTARITSNDAGSGACTSPVVVLFDFTPNDPSKASLAVTGVRVQVGEGVDPSRAWVDASGLSVGSVHPATRSDETHGSCSPREINLDGVDYTTACR